MPVGRERCADDGDESQGSNSLTMANVICQLDNWTYQSCASNETYTEEISMDCEAVGKDRYVISAT
jgi:hypothetical protein